MDSGEAKKKQRLDIRSTVAVLPSHNLQLRRKSLQIIKILAQRCAKWDIPFNLIEFIIAEMTRLTMENSSKEKDIATYHASLIDASQVLLQDRYARYFLPVILRLLCLNLHSKNLKIQEEARKGLEACRLLVHPEIPPICRPQPMQTAPTSSTKLDSNFNSTSMASPPDFGIQPMGDALFAKQQPIQISQEKPLKRTRSPSPIHKESADSVKGSKSLAITNKVMNEPDIYSDHQPKPEVEFKAQEARSQTTQAHNLEDLKHVRENGHMGNGTDSESDMSIPEINIDDSDDE